MIDLGDLVQVAVSIRDADGNLTNPSTADLTITLPDGTTDTPAVPLPPTELGILRVDYQTVQFGLHRWRLTTTGPVTAHADAFNVVDSSWPALVGLAEVKEHLNIPASDTSQDDELRGFILSASEVAEDIVGEVAQTEAAETYSGGSPSILLRRRPVLSVTEVQVDGTVVDASTYIVSPSGVLRHSSGCWPRGFHNVQATYVSGRTAAQASVLDATKELIRINWRPQQGGNYSPFDGGQADDFGAGGDGAQGMIRLGFFVPNTVMQRLMPHARAPHVA